MSELDWAKLLLLWVTASFTLKPFIHRDRTVELIRGPFFMLPLHFAKHQTTVASLKKSIKEIVPKVTDALTLLISSVVTAAVNESTKLLLQEWGKHMDMIRRGQESAVKAATKAAMEISKLKFECDKVEQTTRKTNIIIRGIPLTNGENTKKVVVDLAAEMGVEMKEQDISVSYRLPGKRGRVHEAEDQHRSRNIFVKFVRYETKLQIMGNKKRLRSIDGKNRVFIEEDLTPLRGKILRQVRMDPEIKRAWTMDGNICCIIKDNDQEMKKTIYSGDELISKLGWSAEKAQSVGIYVDFP
ncbi:uncharacterized protein LOC126383825 [Epinephelus moara]|uniref:uncharacterized protein LOC126383825 n=1 Tax=Epinephelus moara TaxID=300413 RepID=UPI00214EA8FA|nr:uncharacterized protein LOC126383825 [Epinephelus moara]